MSSSNLVFNIGSVSVQPLLGDITDLKVDAVVAPCGTSSAEVAAAHANWVRTADEDMAIAHQLSRLGPLQLGDVAVTTAGSLKNARYMIHAVIFDSHADRASGSIEDSLGAAVARKCVGVASSLGLKSVAFTPWGTGVRAVDPARVTALMVQAIVAQLQVESGSLERIYLVSNREDHYQWFVDRTFVFRIVLDQLTEVSQSVEALDISDAARDKILSALHNVQRNVVVYNETFGGAKYNISLDEAKGIAIGDRASARTSETLAKSDRPEET